MLSGLVWRQRVRKKKARQDQKHTFVCSAEYYEKIRSISTELFNKYINDLDRYGDEVFLSWGALFYFISNELDVNSDRREEIKQEIRKRLEFLIYKIPDYTKSNWELGFAASIYLYVLKEIGFDVKDLEVRLDNILKNVKFYMIPSVSKVPEFLGFTFAMFGKKCLINNK
jgi:hypothetical protein